MLQHGIAAERLSADAIGLPPPLIAEALELFRRLKNGSKLPHSTGHSPVRTVVVSIPWSRTQVIDSFGDAVG